MRKILLVIFVFIAKIVFAQPTQEEMCFLYTTALDYILEKNIIHNFVVEKKTISLGNPVLHISVYERMIKDFESLGLDYKIFKDTIATENLNRCKCLKVKFLSQKKFLLRQSKLNFLYGYKQREFEWFYFSNIAYSNNYVFFKIFRQTFTGATYYYYFLFEKKYTWNLIYYTYYN